MFFLFRSDTLLFLFLRFATACSAMREKFLLFCFLLFFSQLIAGGCGNRQADVSLVDDWRENEPNMRGRKVMFDGFYVDYE